MTKETKAKKPAKKEAPVEAEEVAEAKGEPTPDLKAGKYTFTNSLKHNGKRYLKGEGYELTAEMAEMAHSFNCIALPTEE